MSFTKYGFADGNILIVGRGQGHNEDTCHYFKSMLFGDEIKVALIPVNSFWIEKSDLKIFFDGNSWPKNIPMVRIVLSDK